MKIVCTRVNGEKFEVEYELESIQNTQDVWVKVINAQNQEKINAAHKALEAWCELVKANIKEARIIPTTLREAEDLRNDEVCRNCHFTLGAHRSGGLNCPEISQTWSTKVFQKL